MNLTLKQLRAFTAVADAGSFTDAAKRLHLTQSGLSLLVKELEEELGIRVFDRSTRKIQLTVAGADFYPLALKVLEDLDNAVKSTLQLQDKERGNVRIACTPLYSSSLLPKAMAQYRLRYPAIHIRLLDSLNEEALARVASGEADFAVAPQRDTPPEIQQEALLKDRFALVCPSGHAFASRASVTWAEVLEHPYISLTRDFTRRLQADLAEHSVTLRLKPTHEVSYVTTALAMVNCGLGIAALPSSALPMISPLGLAAVAVDEPIVYRQLSFFKRRGQSLSPAAVSFHEFLVDFTAAFASESKLI